MRNKIENVYWVSYKLDYMEEKNVEVLTEKELEDLKNNFPGLEWVSYSRITGVQYLFYLMKFKLDALIFDAGEKIRELLNIE